MKRYEIAGSLAYTLCGLTCSFGCSFADIAAAASDVTTQAPTWRLTIRGGWRGCLGLGWRLSAEGYTKRERGQKDNRQARSHGRWMHESPCPVTAVCCVPNRLVETSKCNDTAVRLLRQPRPTDPARVHWIHEMGCRGHRCWLHFRQRLLSGCVRCLHLVLATRATSVA